MMVRLPLTAAEIERGERLGALLRRARGERTILDVALDAGISPETLRKIESGRVATPAFPTVAAVADVLGLSLDAVWTKIGGKGAGLEPRASRLAAFGIAEADAARRIAKQRGTSLIGRKDPSRDF